MIKKVVFFSVAILALAGCRYTPFLKYYNLDKNTDLPKFKKHSYLSGSNNNMRAAYDVTQYNWEIAVFPEKKSIAGSMEIWMDIVQSQDTLLFDLHDNLKLDSVKCRKPLKYKRKRDLVYIIFPEGQEEGGSIEITFYYHGKPPTIIGEGPVIWKKDSNDKPWFSTQTEGLGVGHLFPCKDLLIDEPEKCSIRLNVPEGLEAACNGVLQRSETKNGRTITEWLVSNSINVYNISFNAGDFVKFQLPYTDINGQEHQLDFYALKENEEAARKFYAQTPAIMRASEELFGEYPWWNDGLKFVESTFSAMEHQGCIAMGSEYELDWEELNTTLVHEIAHEWWGNSITAADYADIWLHEGLATYGESLVAEKLYGYDNYLRYCRNQMYWGIFNKRPVQKVPNVRYTSWAAYADGDIYNKGAMLMHTLRTQMENDELFMKILKDMQLEFRDTNISSAEFEAYFLEKCECDLQAIFDRMLRVADAPELAYSVFISEDRSIAELKYRWAEGTPADYPMKIKFIAGDEVVYIEPNGEAQSKALSINVDYKMQPWLSGYFTTVSFDGKKK